MSVYYNDNDPYCAQWLRNLIAAGHLPAGEVDERSIKDVQPADVRGFGHCHFFAGIGGWPLALKLSCWPAERQVWTASCPCQPFSQSGSRRGLADERHLWPEAFRLIGECRPPTVFGEQVASKDGRKWLAGVFADLESVAYAVAGADLCAASVKAPHIRQRLFWVGYADRAGLERRKAESERAGERVARPPSMACDLPDAAGTEFRQVASAWNELGDAPNDIVLCRDGKARRVESGTFPLADGVPNRVGRFRGYGNAIVPQVAAEFIAAFMDCRP